MKRIFKIVLGYFNAILQDMEKHIIDSIDVGKTKEMKQFYLKCFSASFSFLQAKRMWKLCETRLDQEECSDSLYLGVFRQSPLLLDNMGLSANKIKELTEPYAKYKSVYCDVLEKEVTNRTISQDDYTNVILDYMERER